MSEGHSSNFAESEPPPQPERDTVSKVLEETLPTLHQELGVDEETEFLQSDPGRILLHPETLSGGEYGRYLNFAKIIDRSFDNIRESIRSHLNYYLERRGSAAASTLIEELKAEIETVRQSFFIEYHEDIADFETILKDGQVKPPEQLIRESSSPDDEKTKLRQKAGAGSAAGDLGYIDRRSRVLQALFMNPTVEVVHTILANTGEPSPTKKEKPGSQYGDLRLILNWEKIRGRTLFTESDLNPRGLSLSLESNREKTNDPTKRQLVFEHALISKAIYNLDARRYPAMAFQNKLSFWDMVATKSLGADTASIRYIEAQILGGFSLDEVKEIWLKQPNQDLVEQITRQYPHIKVQVES